MSLRPKQTIAAVHPEDVTQFFERLGLMEALRDGALRCHVCGALIDPASFRAARRCGSSFRFVCMNDSCFGAFLEADCEVEP